MSEARCHANCGRHEEIEDARLDYTARPQLALAALLHMLSRYPATRKPAIALAIIDHLRLVGDDDRLDPTLRDCARDLIGDWEGFAVLSSDHPALTPGLPC